MVFVIYLVYRRKKIKIKTLLQNLGKKKKKKKKKKDPVLVIDREQVFSFSATVRSPVVTKW